MKKDRFIIKGKDFTVETDSIKINYWDYSNEGCSLEVTWIDSFEELENIYDNFDYEEVTLTNEFYCFSYEYDEENCIVKIICSNSYLNDDILECINEDFKHVNCNFDLPTKFKCLTFTEFKKLFGLKGTKKKIIENCPPEYELNFLTVNWNTKIKYTLYKTVEENLQYIQYRCDLGTYKIQ